MAEARPEAIAAVAEALYRDPSWHEQLGAGGCVLRSERVAELALDALDGVVTVALGARDIALAERDHVAAALDEIRPTVDAAVAMAEEAQGVASLLVTGLEEIVAAIEPRCAADAPYDAVIGRVHSIAAAALERTRSAG